MAKALWKPRVPVDPVLDSLVGPVALVEDGVELLVGRDEVNRREALDK